MLVRYILGGESLRQIHLDGRSPEAAKSRWKLLKSCPPHILEYVRALKAAEPTVPAGIDAALFAALTTFRAKEKQSTWSEQQDVSLLRQ